MALVRFGTEQGGCVLDLDRLVGASFYGGNPQTSPSFVATVTTRDGQIQSFEFKGHGAREAWQQFCALYEVAKPAN